MANNPNLVLFGRRSHIPITDFWGVYRFLELTITKLVGDVASGSSLHVEFFHDLFIDDVEINTSLHQSTAPFKTIKIGGTMTGCSITYSENVTELFVVFELIH